MHRVFGHRFRRTSLLIAGCIGCLIGLGLARRGYSATAAAAGSSLVLCILLYRFQTLLVLVIFALSGASVGLWRGAGYMQALAAYTPLYGQKVVLTAMALNDATYNRYKQLTFDAHSIRLENGQPLTGKLSVSGFGLNSVYYGDEIQIKGKVSTTLGAAQGRMSFAQLTLIKHNPSYIGDVRRRFAAGLQNALPEPAASFSLGILVGQRATLPQDVKDALLAVGLTHIIAVSGYNLTIILRASKRLLAQRSKRLSTLLSFGLIIIFLLITGFSASIVRAAVISGLSIFASYYGRTIRPVLLIFFVAALTALFNPVYLWSDAGWYLSFLAFAGVIIIGPLLASRMPAWVQNSTILMIAVESVAAEMTTLPYVLHTFGEMSYVGVVGNTLIVAFIPLAMLFSVVAGVVGMAAASLVGWVAWPAVLVLTYMLNIAQLLSNLPYAFSDNRYLSQATTLQLYAIVLLVWAGLHFKNKSKPAILTDKKTLVLPEHERMHIT